MADSETGRMRRFRPLLIALAIVFSASTVLYSALWLYAVTGPGTPPVELGFDDSYLPAEHAVAVTGVRKDSPAQGAGLRTGDRIVAIEGQPPETPDYLAKVWMTHKPGDSVHLTVKRAGESSPLHLTGVFRARSYGSLPEYVATQVRHTFPVPFVIVGLTVLFLRIEDPNVWLLALLFASFSTTPGSAADESAALGPSLLTFVKAYRAVFISLLGCLFYWFFAVFPVRSPMDRKVPWLKWTGLAFAAFFCVFGIRSGEMSLPAALIAAWGQSVAERVTILYAFIFLALGLASLISNLVGTTDPETKRKIRVIFWGTIIGVAPGLLQLAAMHFAQYRLPLWADTLVTLNVLLFPLSFGYAVVKHRVLEIPVLLKRSARYLLVQRGFNILLSLVSIGLTLLFAISIARYAQPVVKMSQPSGIALGAVFGTMLLWTGSQTHRRVSGRIDRAFFRSAYDARVILEDLAVTIRATRDRAELARLLERQLRTALNPSFVFTYFRQANGALTPAPGSDPPLPELEEIAAQGAPSEITFPGPLQSGCVVPILDRDSSLIGCLVLGPRLSEEPYSSEDFRLLASVASQAGVALENMQLAAEIAERLETERRTSREMEIAKEVQTRLLPADMPGLDTLDCAARCVQARSVGGDYYDFLDLGTSCTGIVLADVSGKGVHAALLMANLQAHLRSQAGIAPQDPARALGQVNRLLWKSTACEHYATLFFGIYEDRSRTLRYVNCGHNAPIWIRANGEVRRLEATATVIGVFENWDGAVEEIEMATGDLLAVFSDGIPEAEHDEEEYGEVRLLEQLNAHRDYPASAIVDAVLAGVQQFSAGTQSDDLTMVVLRAV